AGPWWFLPVNRVVSVDVGRTTTPFSAARNLHTALARLTAHRPPVKRCASLVADVGGSPTASSVTCTRTTRGGSTSSARTECDCTASGYRPRMSRSLPFAHAQRLRRLRNLELEKG